MGEHTSIPWRFEPWHIQEGPSAVLAPEGWIICTTSNDENASHIVKCVNSHDALVKKLEEIHDITQDTTLSVECWQKLQNIAATAASALASIKERA